MTKNFRLDSKCNSNCSCSLDVYNPICGADDVLYYSPCYAGCLQTYQAQFNNNTESPITVRAHYFHLNFHKTKETIRIETYNFNISSRFTPTVHVSILQRVHIIPCDENYVEKA